jgi:hypothetical protein
MPGFPEGARETARQIRAQRGIFNRYVRALNQKSTTAKLDELQAQLAKGVVIKKVPVFQDGQRVGSVEKEVPMLPSDRARLMARIEALKAKKGKGVNDDLRQKFLDILPSYAARYNLTRDILLNVGVPEEDLDAANIQ